MTFNSVGEHTSSTQKLSPPSKHMSSFVTGTSNWSGDYFDGGSTGAAFVAQQHGEGEKGRPLVAEMKGIFLRDWYSEYTHSVSDYTEKCLLTRTGAFCEADKDPALLATSLQ
uniref:Uncharacterized protein n=1 Tax=Parascaris equorum TaxID=6256 RepID=A0A914S619_PAREQ